MKACDLERRCKSAADVWCHVGGKPMRLCYHCAAEAVKAKQWVEYHWDADLEGECPPAATRVLSEAEREAQLADEDVQGKARQAAGHEDNPRTRVTDMGSKLRTLVLRADADKNPGLCRIADCTGEPKRRGLCDADYAAVKLREMMDVYALPSQRPRRVPEPAKAKAAKPTPARAMSDSEILDAICKEMGIDADASPEAVIAKVRLRTLQSREFLEAVRDALRLREDLTPSDIVVNLRQLYAAAGDVGAAQSEARVFLADVRAQLKLAADATPEHCLKVLRQVYGQAANEGQFWANVNRWLTELRPTRREYSTNPVEAVNELVDRATARGRIERHEEISEIDAILGAGPPFAQPLLHPNGRPGALRSLIESEAGYREVVCGVARALDLAERNDGELGTVARVESLIGDFTRYRAAHDKLVSAYAELQNEFGFPSTATPQELLGAIQLLREQVKKSHQLNLSDNMVHQAANATLRAALIRYVRGTETWAADLTDAELVEKVEVRRKSINETWSTAKKQLRDLALMPDREDTTLLEYVQGVRERLQAEERRASEVETTRDEVIEDIWTAAGGVGQAPEWHELLSMVRGRLAPPRDTKREALTALFDEVEDQGEVSSFVVRAMRLLAGCDARAVDDRTSAGVQDA